MVSAAVLVFMMFFTAYVVILRQIFDTPTLGVVDIMELSLVALIFIAMPGVFFRNENVTVDIVDRVVSPRIRTMLIIFGHVCALFFLVAMMIEMLPLAWEKYNNDEVTMTLSIDRFVHWVPILFGFSVSIIATIWVLGRVLTDKSRS